jgi:hypothetical protein
MIKGSNHLHGTPFSSDKPIDTKINFFLSWLKTQTTFDKKKFPHKTNRVKNGLYRGWNVAEKKNFSFISLSNNFLSYFNTQGLKCKKNKIWSYLLKIKTQKRWIFSSFFYAWNVANQNLFFPSPFPPLSFFYLNIQR